MADRLRQIAQRLKDRVHLSQFGTTGKDKVDQLITKYASTSRVSEIAERFKHEAIRNKVQELVTKYEKFTGVEEILALQNTVNEAQDKFIAAQDRRRDLGRLLADIEARLKELHAEMQNTMKGDDKYLHLCTEEHKLIIQERALRTQFSDAEREERELFATMSAAVKLGHERERAHAERNKYWYIVASIFGTVLGIAGSTINNHLKMSEFRDMMEQQMARSASVLYTIAGGTGGGAVVNRAGTVLGIAGSTINNHLKMSEFRDMMEQQMARSASVLYTIAGGTGGGAVANRADIADAMKTEFAYQEQLAQNLKLMQDNISHLVNKQNSLIEHLHHQDEVIEKHMRDLKKIVVVASQNSAKSDAELAKALSVVHHDLDEVERERDEVGKNKIALEPNQIVTGLGVLICAAVIFGNIIGRVS